MQISSLSKTGRIQDIDENDGISKKLFKFET